MQSVWDLLNVSAQASSGSTTTMVTAVDSSTGMSVPTFIQPITSVPAYSTSTLASATATGSGFELVRSVATGDYTVGIKNLVLDISNATVYADIYTLQGTYLHQLFLMPSASTTTVGAPSSPDWNQYWQVNGGFTDLQLDATVEATTKVQTGSLGIINRGLGITGVSISVMKAVPFANVNLTTAPVPEPLTYPLMALGLVSAVAVARRRNNTRAD